MDKILYDRQGYAVAYIATDYRSTIFLWEGTPVAYLYEEEHVYGINGRHLGWFKNEIIYNDKGERIGFAYTTCPRPIAKPPPKYKKQPVSELRSRWSAPPFPKLLFREADQDFANFLKQGQIILQRDGVSTEGTQD